jgi:hydrogen peroxide-dependent heme synthase
MSLPPDPVIPLTLEGSSVLHQMARVQWSKVRSLAPDQQATLAAEVGAWLALHPQSALYAMLGHKGDLMLLHFRPDFASLVGAQAEVRRLALSGYLEHTASYLSVVELGLYESTRKSYDELAARGLTPGADGWEEAIRETVERQRKAMVARLYPEVPPQRYLCFYPMDRRRGEDKNWYQIPFAERQSMMHEHGLVGRKYAGLVKQIISGSIGFDDWEWGVDLFADEPLEFKRLIYEMRFDEVSAVFALFGTFYVGQRLDAAGLAAYFS